jgi:excinuclease UvrABC helicase subunit UvrB
MQFVYNNSQNHITQLILNQLLHEFDCEIHIDVADNIIERRISAAQDHVKKLHQLCQKLRLKLVKTQEQMMIYYNTHHVLKQFKVENFVKLLIKNLKLKCCKLSLC